MNALTLAQPVASAMFRGKRIENRTWAPPEPPGWIAIHAGASWWRGPDPKRPTTQSVRAARSGLEFCADRWWPPATADDLATVPQRCFLGIVHVHKIVDVEAVADELWAIGPKCWLVDKAIPLPTPIPCFAGALGLWRVTDPAATIALEGLIP